MNTCCFLARSGDGRVCIELFLEFWCGTQRRVKGVGAAASGLASFERKKHESSHRVFLFTDVAAADDDKETGTALPFLHWSNCDFESQLWFGENVFITIGHQVVAVATDPLPVADPCIQAALWQQGQCQRSIATKATIKQSGFRCRQAYPVWLPLCSSAPI